jgi:hypothetical protein
MESFWCNGWWRESLSAAKALADKLGSPVFATDGRKPIGEAIYTPAWAGKGLH